ncbi:hypothetical protein [Pseudonocardia dioxanivorans]|uniref:hypothetical protein n=1 Tax=Pseudonocardia dioxanivorans TaxID=240495 RepID=UPI0018F8AF10|nr:hypothetical protein [Pseudonocardia dioxanivorans]
MSGDREPIPEPGRAEHGSGPVFVDGTGRRSKRVKRVAYVAASACAAYMAVVGVSLAAHQETTLFALPGSGSVAAGDPESAGILSEQEVVGPGAARPATRPPVPLGAALARAIAPVASAGALAPTAPAAVLAPLIAPVAPVAPAAPVAAPAVPPVAAPVTPAPPAPPPGTTPPPPNTEGGADPAPADPGTGSGHTDTPPS